MAIYFSEAAENLLLQEAALLKRIIENINKDGINRRGFLASVYSSKRIV